MSHIILHASSRSNGNTAVIASYLSEALNCPAIDLSACSIAPYSYDYDYPEGDTFLAVIEKALAYDHWILLTPVYWYTMSAQMKTFLDRWSDLVSYRKDLGQQMVSKKLWAVCCGSDREEILHFFAPFRLSAGYMDMLYGGDLHAWLGRKPVMKPEVQVLLDEWVKILRNATF